MFALILYVVQTPVNYKIKKVVHNNKKILIVEEDRDLSNSLALFFSDKFTVKVLTDLAALNNHIESSCILLIDANYVHEGGYEVLKSIKSSIPDCTIVLMYRASSKKYPDHATYQQYADASVFKPFDAQEIYNIISRIGKQEPQS